MAIRVSRDRLLASSAIVLSASASLLWRAAALRPSLEVLLNLLWVGLALGTLGAWACRRGPAIHSHRLELLSLVFVFALLFPVVSASDDLAQPLDDDACTTQAMVSGLKAEKHVAASLHQPLSALPALPFLSTLVRSPEAVAGPAAKSLPVAMGQATGNHSPPLV